MPALPARASPPDSGRFERHRLTTRVRPQNFQNLYDPNSAYDFNSARFLVLSENQPKTAIHQIVACSKGTMAAIFTTALAKKPAFLRRQFRKKYDRKKVRNSSESLNRHSKLYGNDPAVANGQALRGQRIFCSNRGQRGGCGRTFPVFLAEVLPRHSVTSAWLWQLLLRLWKGGSTKAAVGASG